ncbi:hypothetical protein HK102_010701 [Quaeritorhiza haematococci]|nr:hypothetical protein HK102_010701 [Quaeritorhiza haematococci]
MRSICLTGVRVSSDDPSIIVPADEGRGGLRGVEMAIVIGFIVAAALIVAGAFWFYIRKRMAERNMEKRVLERRQRLREYQQQHEQMHRQLQLQQQQYQMQQQQQQQQVEVDDAFLDRISLTQAETTVQPLGIETVEYLPQYEPDALDVVSADSIVARLFVDADGVGGVDGATDYDSPVRRGEEEHTPGALSSLPRSMRSASEQDGGHLGVEQTATTEISTSATINVNVDVPDDVNEPPSYEAATDLIG